MNQTDRYALALFVVGLAALGLSGQGHAPKPAAERSRTALPAPVRGKPFAFLENYPGYHKKTKRRGRRRAINRIQSIVLHDREGRYTPSLAPYHIEVTQSGEIMQHYRADQIAPHAYRYNRYSIGVAYGGYAGEIPGKKAMQTLEYIITGLRRYNPKWRIESHGEAYARTKNTRRQASKYGRSLIEAAWREKLHIAGYSPAIAVPKRRLMARRRSLRAKLRTIGMKPYLKRPMCIEPLN